MNQTTIYWHDYETWGVNPQKDYPCQFAGVRTDLDLNIIDKPLMIYSQIPNDYLPQPQACLITGITPQLTLRDGLSEANFIRKIHQQFSQANSCVAGYNSLRFDDEVTRYTLYRNFYDPYAREWQNGNSRWDIIDLARACYALRPEGIEWPLNDEGIPSFKLQELTSANGLLHEAAHDAMSDVYATIALAKLIKDKQNKLYQFAFENRSKSKIAALIDCDNLAPLVHVSSKLPALHGCCTWIVPVAYHPTNKNAVIVLNLALDPSPLDKLSVDEIKQKMYQPNSMLAENEQRLPLKLIHLNKCPFIAPAKTLTEENATRLNIDRGQCLSNLQKIKAMPSLVQKLQAVFNEEFSREIGDPEQALYSGGFFNEHDKALINQVNQAQEHDLMELKLPFKDPRLSTLLFRYRARNYPQTLSHSEVEKWQQHRQFRLMDSQSSASIKLSEYFQQLEQLSQEHVNNPDKLAIITALYKYAQNL
ncbi:exodeoxyribonuclease I [Paraglaciecola hydrolytica]|uniref:Exodeoxyribonuclease I n=1 Tax=Paraglaciecola hydrolytica TaxID=1799789 RepID=A0A136A6H0_9ALTE|nr:exodeoxyribonuclease I [Paraglaciecola hydrolytica]KXI30827.1 exodeoxyribonuclease I [Paraglaciecola hydrolytica]